MSKKPSELSNEELLKQEKTMRGLTFTFIGVIIALFILTIYSLIQKHFGSTMITPVIFLPLIIINLKNWRELKDEVKRRGL